MNFRRRIIFVCACVGGALFLVVRALALIPSIQDSLCREMSHAVYRNSTAGVITLLFAGANPNRSVHGSTPAIHAAAALNNAGVVRLLLAVGTDPNLKTKFDVTPLWEAENMKSTEVATLLRNAGGYAYISPNAP